MHEGLYPRLCTKASRINSRQWDVTPVCRQARKQRQKILFRLHLTPYRGAVLPYGIPESIVMGCVTRNLSIPTRTATRVQGRLIREMQSSKDLPTLL